MTDPYRNQDVALVDLVDRLLDTGAAILGDVVLSVAGVDLVYVSLRALVASVDSAMGGSSSGYTDVASKPPGWSQPRHQPSDRGRRPPYRTPVRPRFSSRSPERGQAGGVPAPGRTGLPAETRNQAPPTRRTEADPDKVERGMAQLVLTLVELIRQLMERQAVRRFDRGTLTAAQENDLSRALRLLAEKMEELKAHFGLDDEDLNIRLGPLGDLL